MNGHVGVESDARFLPFQAREVAWPFGVVVKYLQTLFQRWTGAMAAQVVLRPEKELRVKDGHPWVFRDNIARFQDVIGAGEIVEVLDSEGEFVAKGYINPISWITVRILSWDKEDEINYDFFLRKISQANEMRRRIIEGRRSLGMEDGEAYRVVYAEADGLPGLIVDRYGDYLVIQILTLGMEIRRDLIIGALVEIFNPKGIFEKSNPKSRLPEGLKPVVGVAWGEVPELITIQQDDLTLLVDPWEGQKTGFFLDQRENRRAFRGYVNPGDRVLDCFCYTGAFSMIAAKRGADVLGLDLSDRAIELCYQNAKLNGVEDRCRFEVDDVFKKLYEMDKDGERFDVIVLDPPAFAKSQDAVKSAIRGYKEINIRAMKLLKSGGILATSSCTQHIGEGTFLNMLGVSARKAKRRAQFLEIRSQPWDHPIAPNCPESRYLKFIICRVI